MMKTPEIVELTDRLKTGILAHGVGPLSDEVQLRSLASSAIQLVLPLLNTGISGLGSPRAIADDIAMIANPRHGGGRISIDLGVLYLVPLIVDPVFCAVYNAT